MKILLTITLILFSICGIAKPRIVNIDEALSTAKHIVFCKIVSFTDSTISYEQSYFIAD